MEHDSLIIEVLALLVAAIVAGTLFARFGLGAILGYLVGGAVIGPWGLGIIETPEEIAYLGEFGVVFLLFVIGIELKPSRLWVMRSLVFGLGGAQVLLTGAVLTAAGWALGLAVPTALVAGFGLALSSTAFGVQILANTNQLSSRWGRGSFSILLFQDLAVVPLLALIPLLAATEIAIGASVGLAFLETLGILAAVIVLGRLALDRALRWTAASRHPEVFTAFALLLVLGFGFATEHAGLSMAMGAFLAGVLLADSEFRHQVELDIQPFRGLLLGLFFMSVGMTVDIGALAADAATVLGLVVGLLVVKAAMIGGLALAAGLGRAGAVQSALLLAQSGEFGFVLFAYATERGVMDAGLADLLVSVVAVSMAATPLLTLLGERLADRLNGAEVPAPSPRDEAPVLIAGFGRVGETVAHILGQMGHPCRAVDLDAETVEAGRARGFKVYFGDARRPEILRALGAARSPLLVVTLDDPRAAERALRTARRHFPDMKVHVRARDVETARRFSDLGASHVVPEALEVSLRLGAEAAKAMGVGLEELTPLIRGLRGQNYQTLLDEVPSHRPEDGDDEATDA